MNYQEERCGRVGEPIPDPRPAVFELVIADHVAGASGIDPRDYFITSGDAVSKAKALSRDLRQAGEFGEADRALRLVDALVAARGEACFLETEYASDHRLLCIPKNPRTRPEV